MTTYALNADVLAGGDWVRRGLVWHWVAAVPEPELVDDYQPNPGYRPADLIACVTCKARMDERCKGSDRSRDHRRRLIKRVCSCGGPIEFTEDVCAFCRADAIVGAA